jgi:hypothetical protein
MRTVTNVTNKTKPKPIKWQSRHEDDFTAIVIPRGIFVTERSGSYFSEGRKPVLRSGTFFLASI